MKKSSMDENMNLGHCAQESRKLTRDLNSISLWDLNTSNNSEVGVQDTQFLSSV